VDIISNFKKLIMEEKGISGCAIFLLIIFVVAAAAVGFLYYQFSGIFQLGSETIEQVFVIVDEIESLENLEKVDDIEDLEELDEVEDLEELEAMEELDIEEIERIKNIAPLVRNIYARLPRGVKDFFLDNGIPEPTEAEEDPETEDEELAVKEERVKTEQDFLPESIEMHPDLQFSGYQDFRDVPGMFWEEIDEEYMEEYINEDTVVLKYETDFPEREIAELRELEEVTEEITDEMIEEEREQLTFIYNVHELADWYKERLVEEGWEMREDKEGIEGRLFYQHEQEGYFIIASLEDFIYTPLK